MTTMKIQITPKMRIRLMHAETTLKNYENGYREAIPASVLITLANTASTANYVHYLLNNSASVDTLGVMAKEAA